MTGTPEKASPVYRLCRDRGSANLAPQAILRQETALRESAAIIQYRGDRQWQAGF